MKLLEDPGFRRENTCFFVGQRFRCDDLPSHQKHPQTSHGPNRWTRCDGSCCWLCADPQFAWCSPLITPSQIKPDFSEELRGGSGVQHVRWESGGYADLKQQETSTEFLHEADMRRFHFNHQVTALWFLVARKLLTTLTWFVFLKTPVTGESHQFHSRLSQITLTVLK